MVNINKDKSKKIMLNKFLKCKLVNELIDNSSNNFKPTYERDETLIGRTVVIDGYLNLFREDK